MEILAETTLWDEFWFTLTIAAVGSLIVIALIVTVLSEAFSEKDFKLGLFAVLLSVLLVVLLLFSVRTFKQGPDIEYKATVTDFNEVYNNGYEIVDREGDLFILRESEAD